MASNRHVMPSLRTILLVIAAIIGAVFFVQLVLGTLFFMVKIVFILIFIGVVISFYNRRR